MVEEVKLAHLPSELKLFIAGFREVKNAAYLRSQLLAANQEFNYAFLDATALLSRRQLFTAAFRAMNDHLHDRLRSNNVQSEVVFCFNPNNNIGDAFRRFGISDSSTDIVVVKVGDSGTDQVLFTKESIEQHLSGAVEGISTAVTDEWLEEVCDLDKTNGDHPANDRANVEVQVLGALALRGAG